MLKLRPKDVQMLFESMVSVVKWVSLITGMEQDWTGLEWNGMIRNSK